MTKENMPPHEDFPFVPMASVITPDIACNGCPLKGATNHKTCSGFSPDGEASHSVRANLADMNRFQTRVFRRQLIAEGVKGMHGDDWYYYNSTGSLNFAYFSLWKVVSADGDTAVLQREEDPREDVISTWRVPHESGQGYVSTFVAHGCADVMDIGVFSENSAVRHSCRPMVVQILGVDISGGELEIKFDKDVDGCLNKHDPDDTDPIYIGLYHNAGNAYNVQYVIEPTFFFGQRKTRPISLSEIPEDGVVTLEATAPVMHDGGFNPLKPAWVFEGRLASTGVWETVPQNTDRLFNLSDGPARVAMKTTKPVEGKADLTLISDLTINYNAFRVTYYAKVPISDSGCNMPGHDRCYWSIPDPSKSAGNYHNLTPGQAGYGASIDADGKHWFCRKAFYTEHTVSDHTATPVKKTASGAGRFPVHGRCSQKGCCDHWKAAENEQGRDAPFRKEFHEARFYYELWGAADAKKQQYQPLIQAYFLQRIQHPSIAWHVGFFGGLTTPGGIHPQVSFNRHGAWAVPYRDSEGFVGYADGSDRYLVALPGATYAYNWRALPLGTDDVPADGHFPSEVSGLSTHRDPLNPASTLISKELYRVGWRVERDTGVLRGRGLAKSTVVCLPHRMVFPNLSKSAVGTQTRSNCTFTVEEGTGDGILEVMALRPEIRPASSLGSRPIHSGEIFGAGLIDIYLENGSHVYSVLDTGSSEIGDSFDRPVPFNGGGIAPVYGGDFQAVDSYQEPDKTLGSAFGGLCRGDSVEINGHLFIVDSVIPFGGPEADGWGDRQLAQNWVAGGYFHAAQILVGGEYVIPRVLPPLSGDFVRYSATSVALTAIVENERPVAIAAGEYWYDQESGIVLVSEADEGVALIIRHRVEDLALDPLTLPDTESSYTPGDVVYETNIPSTEWGSASAKTITADGDVLSVISGAVDGGEYAVDTSGTFILITTSTADAAKVITATLDFAVEAAAPLDYYTTGGNGLSFLKNMDKIRLIDNEAEWLSDNVSSLSAETAEFWAQKAVLMPGPILERTDYQGDTWIPVEIVGDGARGFYRIPAAMLATFPEKFCLALPAAEWLDHRGLCPAYLPNTTEAAIDTLEWIECGLQSGRGGSFSVSLYAWQEFGFVGEDPCGGGGLGGYGPHSTSGEGGNHLRQFWGGGGALGMAEAYLAFSASGFGFPDALAYLPKGTVIVEAFAEIHGGGLTRVTNSQEDGPFNCATGTYDPGPEPPDPITHLEDIGYAVLGFTGEDELGNAIYEVIGGLPGAQNGVNTVDITDIVRTQFADQNVGRFDGYGIVFAPVDLNTVTAEGLLPSMGPTRSRAWCEGDSCYPGYFSEFYTSKSTELFWDNVSVQRVIVRVQLPNEDRIRTLVRPRLPAQSGATIAAP